MNVLYADKVINSGQYYCGAQEVMELIGCKRDKAYKIIRTLREELISKKLLTSEYPAGKIPRKYLYQRLMIED